MKVIEGTKRNSIPLLIISIVCFFIQTNNILLDLVIHSIAMIPLAFILGELTSSISEYIGEKKGGLLTATLGNLPEIIMGIWSIKLGLIDMLKASLIGAIVNNMLLVLGISILLGGIKHKQQRFNKNIAKTNFNMLLLAMSAIAIIACIDIYAAIEQSVLVNISIVISIIFISIYLLGLIFSLYTHSSLFSDKKEEDEIVDRRDRKVIRNEIIKLFIKIIIVVIGINFLSEKIIGGASSIIEVYNVSEYFMGIILIPTLGNIGENISAIVCAIKNKVNLSLEIAVGSSIQIALFATPLLILIQIFLGSPITLVFPVIHIIIAAIAIFMAYTVFADGKTYWFEGTILIAVYVIITICYFYV